MPNVIELFTFNLSNTVRHTSRGQKKGFLGPILQFLFMRLAAALMPK